ncbi:MAG: hypothetical protein ACKVT1_09140 [Dehalococcoidia bacterium]
MKSFAAAALSALAACLIGAVLLRTADLGQVPWFATRAAGLMAFVTLSLSMILGLTMSSKSAPRAVSKLFVFEMHQFLSVISLVLLGVHAGALIFDGFLRFSPLEVLVPFLAPYQRGWVGIGVIGGWLALITALSFWFKARIGHRAWRKLHYATFGAYVLALIHGMTARTDTALAPVYVMYIVSMATVAALITVRIGQAWTRTRGRRAVARPFRGTRPLAR